ncbi:sulfurtransferase [Scleromatobacter humisilvae]|uniref:Sulfurtransferase n=1 Tax=Scleromatobacter humisilvae TaxID=2897159 RepID=A0A9X2C0H6_9BURK|nr:sulfurtransferase [Scleromatobacter humisilvae]MCK9687783.1 sulfurtransferase [Scleromatobacter humisilvae]
MTAPTLPTPLVSPEQLLAALAAGAAPVIIDCSFDLADVGAGERAFAEGHLPGAVYAHLDRDLAGPKTGTNGRHPLPARADWAATLARLGVTPARAVVVYDAQGGMYAARAWWMLLWAGHRAVSVLDGGIVAWKAAGGAVESGATTPVAVPGAYPLGDSLVASVDADALQKSLGRVTLLDARAGERYRGEVEPLDKRAGHIPGARSRFFKDNLGTDGRFKPAQELRAAFEAFGAAPAQVVHQCGSGVTACHNLLAMEAAGLPGSALYPGSWSEWSADPRRPVAVG